MKRESGFTLVEIMTVVGITGLIATIAIPEFQYFRMRAMRLEEETAMAQIERSLRQYYNEFDAENIRAQWNPTNVRRARSGTFNPDKTGWNQLDLTFTGSMRHSFFINARVRPNVTVLVIQSRSDLDKDGRYRRWRKIWRKRRDQDWQLTRESFHGDDA